jgi:hypothetical protein
MSDLLRGVDPGAPSAVIIPVFIDAFLSQGQLVKGLGVGTSKRSPEEARVEI